ncbi:MAG: HAD-IA family hydrolase [Betaproteobacteria bacterium]|nr:HAD-IA family hydrolase [Betaproteobacteria bacterium]
MRRAVLLDMGGVLVELGGERPFLELMGGNLTAAEMWRRWLASPAVRAHETGRMETGEFTRAAVREFGLSVTPEEFLVHFRGWLRGPYDGAHELLDELAARHDTAILTNISGVHWPIAASYGLFERVGRVIASHHVGEIKPDRAFFELALAELRIGADAAVFFDDNAVNVEGARSCGIEAYVVRGVEETRAKLADMDLLSR